MDTIVSCLETQFDSRGHDEPLLSIIIPVYNTRSYVIDTLTSVQFWSGTEVEIIVVDDGSTDDAGKIVRSWAEFRAVPLLLLRQPNAGLSAARNTGISEARGRYLLFIDSDDLFDSGTIRRMVSVAEGHESDVVICRSVCFDSSSLRTYDFPDRCIWDEVVENRKLYNTNCERTPRLLRLEPNANTKLIRRSVASKLGLRFPEGLLFEDLPPHVNMLSACKKVSLLSETGFYYRVGRSGQLTRSKGQRRFDMLKIARLALQESHRHSLSVEAGANLAGMAARMLYWCGEHVMHSQKEAYYDQACQIFLEYPEKWRTLYASRYALDSREKIIISALDASDYHYLSLIASGGKAPAKTMSAALSWGSDIIRSNYVSKLRNGVLGFGWRRAKA